MSQRSKLTEEELSELVDAGFDAILVRESDGRLAYWNKGAELLYGYGADEAIGRVSHSLLRTEPTVPLSQIIRQVEKKGYWTGELGHTCKDGKKIQVLSRWSRRHKRSKLPDILEVNTDITKRKASEARVQEMNDILLGNEHEILRLRALLAEHGISAASAEEVK